MINNIKKEYDVLIIPVRKEDAEFINQVANNQELMTIFHDNPTEINEWKQAIEDWIQDDDEKDFIIIRVENELPIGWFGINGLQSKNRSAWLKMIAILPEHWDKGYGSYTIKKIKQMLKCMEIDKVLLWTDESNIRAQQCYKANNFEVICKKKDSVGNIGVVLDRVLMECSLY